MFFFFFWNDELFQCYHFVEPNYLIPTSARNFIKEVQSAKIVQLYVSKIHCLDCYEWLHNSIMNVLTILFASGRWWYVKDWRDLLGYKRPKRMGRLRGKKENEGNRFQRIRHVFAWSIDFNNAFLFLLVGVFLNFVGLVWCSCNLITRRPVGKWRGSWVL